jgi:hypothetical protein
MKNIFLVLLLMFPFFVSAQLREVEALKKIGEIKRGSYMICKITYSNKGDYTLTYWDASYKTIDVFNSINFQATEDELKSVKAIFKNQLSAERNSTKEFGLGDNLIKLITKKAFGVQSLWVYISSSVKSGYFIMNEKELEELMPFN